MREFCAEFRHFKLFLHRFASLAADTTNESCISNERALHRSGLKIRDGERLWNHNICLVLSESIQENAVGMKVGAVYGASKQRGGCTSVGSGARRKLRRQIRDLTALHCTAPVYKIESA